MELEALTTTISTQEEILESFEKSLNLTSFQLAATKDSTKIKALEERIAFDRQHIRLAKWKIQFLVEQIYSLQSEDQKSSEASAAIVVDYEAGFEMAENSGAGHGLFAGLEGSAGFLR